MKNHLRAVDTRATLLVIAMLLAMAVVLDPFRLNLMGKYMSFAFVALGVVLLWGYGGVLSLGQGLFFGAGGYMMAMFLKLEASAPELPDFMVWSSIERLPVWWQPFHSLTLTLLLIVVLKHIEVSIAYAVWAGVGTAAVALIGITFLGEQADVIKMASIALVIIGVVGLNLSGAH